MMVGGVVEICKRSFLKVNTDKNKAMMLGWEEGSMLGESQMGGSWSMYMSLGLWNLC